MTETYCTYPDLVSSPPLFPFSIFVGHTHSKVVPNVLYSPITYLQEFKLNLKTVFFAKIVSAFVAFFKVKPFGLEFKSNSPIKLLSKIVYRVL